MQREHGLDHALRDEPIVVAARQVRGFVQADLVQFFLAGFVEEPVRDEDRWPVRARRHGHENFVGPGEADLAGACASLQEPLAEPGLQVRGRIRSARAVAKQGGVTQRDAQK